MTHAPEYLFPTVRIVEGYDIDEVDAFIQEVVPLVVSHAPDRDLAQRITHVRFSPVRLRRGYDMDEVDHYLDRLLNLALYGRRPS